MQLLEWRQSSLALGNLLLLLKKFDWYNILTSVLPSFLWSVPSLQPCWIPPNRGTSSLLLLTDLTMVVMLGNLLASSGHLHNAFFKTLKKGKHLFVSLETNLFNVATLPVKALLCISIILSWWWTRSSLDFVCPSGSACSRIKHP